MRLPHSTLWRRFGARSPNVLPAESMAKPICSRKNALCRAADSVLCVPSSPRRDRHQKMRNPEMNQPSPITARQLENALMAISTHGGIETYPFASRPVWRVRQTAGVIRTQNAAREPHGRHAPNAKHRDKAAPPRRPAPARANTPAGAKTGQTQRRAGALFTRV